MCLIACLAVLALSSSPARAEVTAEQVIKSIEDGVRYLKGQQDKTRGGWPEYPGQPGGLTSLCTLALLNCGVPAEDPAIKKALLYLQTIKKPDMVYSVSLQTMVYAAAAPDKYRSTIEANVTYLESIQVRTGEQKGSWKYSGDRGQGDNSNTQFAMLALHEAEKVGVPVKEATWRLAHDYWLRTQKQDGSWGYFEGQPSTGSMTCAGISSLIIASGKISGGDAKVVDNVIHCCSGVSDDSALEKGMQWMGRHFSVHSVPSNKGASGTGRLLYYLYGIERVGRLSGRRFIGDHDWYREGAEMLISNQDKLSGYWKGSGSAEVNPHIATSFALLFLGKGRRPVVMSPLIHSVSSGVVTASSAKGDWNHHRAAVQNLTESVSFRWKHDLSWQTIDFRTAELTDLMQTPVLFISGSERLTVTEEQKKLLRQYVDQGGFIFAEAACDGGGFDRDFRALMKEIFPDSKLALLPSDHGIWNAEAPVPSKYHRPLYGIEACCRTSVVYCPESLSCYWELSTGKRKDTRAETVREQVAAGIAIGHNVLAYATNRRLKEKLAPTSVERNDATPPTRSTLVIPKIDYGKGSDIAPNAWSNLLVLAAEELELRIDPTKKMIAPDDPKLADYPMVFMHGRSDFKLTPTARKALKQYLERGGLLFVDSICASDSFTLAFRREMKAMFPTNKLEPLPEDHEIFSGELNGFKLRTLTLRDPRDRAPGKGMSAALSEIPPYLEGLMVEDRLAVIFSPYDISCAMENSESLECKGYIKPDAAKLGVNVVLYGLLQ